MIEIEESTCARVRNLIMALREMPPDVPYVDEESSEEEIMEHPVVDLLMSEIEWLGPLWPLLSEFSSIDLASPGSPEEPPDFAGGHEDRYPNLNSTLLLLAEEAYPEKLRLAGGGQIVYDG